MLEIKNLNKSIFFKDILKNVNLKLKKGKILALLGENGSGKTTLFKILSNLSSKSSGEVYINGEKLSKRTNRFISYLVDESILDSSELVEEAISNCKLLYNNFDKEKAIKLLKEFKIDVNSKIKTLSKGNIEKLNLILTLSTNAKLYLLDEPIAGVDILTRKEILKLIINNISEDSSVIISTHLISDIESIFDEVCFIKDGTLSEIYDIEKVKNEKGISTEELYINYFGGKND